MRRLLLLALLSACGSSSDPPDAPTAEPDPDFADTAAIVEVAMRSFDGGGDTSITGNLVVEAPIWPYTVEPVVGACRYSVRGPMTCGFDCDGVCVDDVCNPFPAIQPAGDLTVTAGGATRTVPFGDAGYAHYEQALPFFPGTELAVSAPGDDFPAFSLTARVPPRLELVDPEDLRLEVGTPLTIRWTPADPSSRVRIVLGADQGHARFRAALIECDSPDDAGAIAVPQEMVDRLADRELWACGDCFPQSARRYYRTSGTAGTIPLSLVTSQSASLYLVPW